MSLMVAKPDAALAAKVGASVRAFRLARGMSQEALSQAVGYTDRVMISRLESGQTLPSISKAIELAKALAVPITALIDDETLDLLAHPPEASLRMRELVDQAGEGFVEHLQELLDIMRLYCKKAQSPRQP